MVVLDTCALIELCKDRPRINKTVISKIEKGAVILSISFAEIAVKIKKKKLKIPLSALQLYQHYAEIPEVEIRAADTLDWLQAIDLSWKGNQDPVDRLITAYAMREKLPLITSDKKIKSFYSKCLW